MSDPPTFPRIAVLEDDGAAADDRVLTSRQRAAWFRGEVVVEEKLDGSNVVIWRDDAGIVRSAGRAGLGARDRAGQLGRLRAWTAEQADALARVLAPDRAIYAEWLYLRHSVEYDRLPSWLVVLDLWSEAAGFCDVDERDARCAEAGLATPPVVYRGTIASTKQLEDLSARSRFARGAMEGLVLRSERDGRLDDRVKWLRPGFVRIEDAAWARGRPVNGLASWLGGSEGDHGGRPRVD
jgi:hypothetical protein